MWGVYSHFAYYAPLNYSKVGGLNNEDLRTKLESSAHSLGAAPKRERRNADRGTSYFSIVETYIVGVSGRADFIYFKMGQLANWRLSKNWWVKE